MRRIPFASFLVLAVTIPASAGSKQPPWVSLDSAGKLVYRTLPRGDHIVDFSYAGYMGGGVVLPRVPVALNVQPSGGDDTAAIQHAIDEVSTMPIHDRWHGAVLLAPGVFQCSGVLNIKASGVVLRGSGAGDNGTTLKMTGDPHVAIAIAGDKHAK